MKTSQGQQFIRKLLEDPVGFCGRGDDYKLVLECFEGFPVEDLRPLLAHSERAVRRAIIWPVSELGVLAQPLINEVVPLAHDPERYVRAYALDVIAVCSMAEDADKYVYVVRSLEDADDVIRIQAMFLVSNANALQLRTATKLLEVDCSTNKLHREGLSQLISNHPDATEVLRLLDSPEPLLRKYGAIAAWLCRDRFPELISRPPSNADQDVRKFLERRTNALKPIS